MASSQPSDSGRDSEASSDFFVSSSEYSSLSNYLEEVSQQTDDSVTTDAKGFSENAVFGYRSFLNNLNHAKIYTDHVNDRKARLSDESREHVDIQPDLIPGFRLVKQFGPQKLTSTILYHAVVATGPRVDPRFDDNHVVVSDISGADPQAHANGTTSEPVKKVIVQLSPNLVDNLNVSRLLNEWYLLSGLNPPKSHRPFTNSSVSNQWLPPSDVVYNPHDPKGSLPITFPRDVPGILYPIHAITINRGTDETEANGSQTSRRHTRVPSMVADKISGGSGTHNTAQGQVLINDLMDNDPSIISDPTQKRFALIYPDNDYTTISEWYASHQTQATSIQASISQTLRQTSRQSSVISSNSMGSGTYGGLAAPSFTSSFGQRHLQGVVPPKPASVVVDIIDDMVKVLRTLGVAHELNICHNGITPYTIYKSETDPEDVRLVGWDYAFSIQPENCTNGYRRRHLASTVDALPYVSPEYAGDVMESVDYRSDFYSIGVVLYELLLGSVPYIDSNPYKMLRMTITQSPIAPTVVAPWVSPELSMLVMRLLHKDPQQRYGDTESVIRDLVAVRTHYVDKIPDKSVVAPPPAVYPEKCGVPLTLIPPRRLFGHTEVRDELLADFDAQGEGVSIFYIKGPSGSGKTSLLNDIRPRIMHSQDIFVSYRYTTEDNLTFYTFFVHIIKEVVSNIMLSSQEEILRWRNEIKAAIDIDIQFMFDAIPRLRELMGMDPRWKRSVTQGAEESQEFNYELRFRYGVRLLLMVFASHGLTLTMDDLDLINPSAFQFFVEVFVGIHEHLVQQNQGRFRCIVTYNSDNENLKKLIHSSLYKKAELFYKDYHLGPVSKEAFREYVGSWLLSNTFKSELASSAELAPNDSVLEVKSILPPGVCELADQMHERCGGNLAFAHYLFVDAVVCSRVKYGGCQASEQRWLIDVDWSQSSMWGKIGTYLDHSLSTDTLRVLKAAAVTRRGNVFHMSDLLVVLSMSLPQCYALLNKLMEARIIMPASTYYKVPFHVLGEEAFPFDFSDGSVWELTRQNTYSFVHDSVYTVVKQRMQKSGEWSEQHRVCSLCFHKKISKSHSTTMSEYLTMAMHMVQSVEVARKDDVKIYVNALIEAGRTASSACNLEFGLQFFEAANVLITEPKYKVKISITICHNLFSLQAYDKCLKFIDEAINKYGFDESIFLLAKVRCLIHSARLDEGLELALHGLKKLGINATLNEAKAEQIYHKIISKVPLSVADIRAMRDFKVTTNPVVLLVYELIGDAIQATYMSEKLWVRVMLVAQMLVMMQSHGVSAFCGGPLVAYANYLITSDVSGNYLQAIEFGKLALALVGRGDRVPLNYIQGFYENYVHTLALFIEPHTEVVRQYEVYVSNSISSHYPGALAGLRGVVRLFLAVFNSSIFSDTHFDAYSFKISQLDHVQVHCLRLLQGDITYEKFNEMDVSELTVDYQFCVLASRIFYLKAHRRYREAADYVFEYFKSQSTLPFTVVHLEVLSIMYAALLRFVPRSDEEAELAAEIRRQLFEFFETWAGLNPGNFSQRFLMLSALKASKDPNVDAITVLDKFEDAVEYALEQQNYYDIGWASHFCATWLIDSGGSPKRIARYLQVALNAFKRTQFKNMVKVIEARRKEFTSSNWAGMPTVDPKHPSAGLAAEFDALELYNKRKHPHPQPQTDDNDTMSDPRDVAHIRARFKNYRVRPSEVDPREPAPVFTGHVNDAIRACLAISEAQDYRSIALNLVQHTVELTHSDYGVAVVKKGSEFVLMASARPDGVQVFRDEPISSRRDAIPYSLVAHVANSGHVVSSSADPLYFNTRFSHDDYFQEMGGHAPAICVPLKHDTEVVAVLYLESTNSDLKNEEVRLNRHNMIMLFCMHAAVSLTKARLYEQMDRTKQAAEEAMAEKASFLSNMSHEIRTPFNSLLSCSLFLLDTDLTATQEEYVQTIKNSAMVTLNIIDGILAFSKIEHGSFTLDVAHFNLNDCIESAIQLSGEQAIANKVELALYNDCPEIATVEGDVTRFRQIIINLMGNAVKFTSEGHILVRVRATEIVGDRYEIVISVEDSGIGIPKNSRNKVFGAFSQVDGSSRRVFGGSGLGLAISKKLCDIMGGSITFDSTEGVGSTFYFTVSSSVTISKTPPQIDWPSQWGAKPKILTVDKLGYIRRSLVMILKWLGVEAVDTDTVKSVENPDQFDVVFIAVNSLSQFPEGVEAVFSKARIIVSAPFGVLLSPQVASYPVILCPYMRSKVVDVLRRVASNNASNGTVNVKAIKGGSDKSKLAQQYPLTILLAEDNVVNTKVALTHLRRFGYEADHAKDGVEVLELCQKRIDDGVPLYDVILMDIQMPRMDGIAATIELKNSLKKQGLPTKIPCIVALTANVAGDDRKRSIDCGMVEFITKPILPMDLGRVLEHIGKEKEAERMVEVFHENM
ncbi:hypothetical protein DIURU_003845 [Diutina rugosa]|uniref:histidine kinase n=1 Tax=Diutina rugosa TaxID=5481 RepID=A0A642UK18_DIURU|nr:uncharacterized protein DIURU_003845 [Diutina rugosa]KAA8900422.1 hypothetical protein DIURU_003845 [Diutina rugosa]